MPRPKKKNAFSLVEIVITMTIIAVLVSFATPSLSRSMEQSHADMVGAGLRSIAVAQRFYWLENRTYAPDLQTLIDEDLIDGNLTTVTPRYEYSIATATAGAFQVQARRRNLDALGNPVFDGAWQGTFTIDETGVIGGLVQGPRGHVGNSNPQLTPSF
ncbi:type IV pilin protein [Rubripirellula obstinata]|nr:prepilin-type N-terminal cleavage/methylation domain-containing protein [Rubripirellula obstinata]